MRREERRRDGCVKKRKEMGVGVSEEEIEAEGRSGGRG